MRHDILFTRQGRNGIEDATVLHLGTEAPSAADSQEAFQRFRKAVAEWLRETQEGRLAWIQSSYNFNIGDLGSMGTAVRACKSLQPYLDKHGVIIYSLQSVNFENHMPYDTVLGDEWPIHKKGTE
jgi:hypothetical protein